MWVLPQYEREIINYLQMHISAAHILPEESTDWSMEVQETSNFLLPKLKPLCRSLNAPVAVLQTLTKTLHSGTNKVTFTGTLKNFGVSPCMVTLRIGIDLWKITDFEVIDPDTSKFSVQIMKYCDVGSGIYAMKIELMVGSFTVDFPDLIVS